MVVLVCQYLEFRGIISGDDEGHRYLHGYLHGIGVVGGRETSSLVISDDDDAHDAEQRWQCLAEGRESSPTTQYRMVSIG